MKIPASDSPCHRDTLGLRPPPGRRTQWSPGNSLLLGRRARDHTTIRPTAVFGTPHRAAFGPALGRTARAPAAPAPGASGWAGRPGPGSGSGPCQRPLVALRATAGHRARRGDRGRRARRGPHPAQWHRQRRWRGVPPKPAAASGPDPFTESAAVQEAPPPPESPSPQKPATFSPGHRNPAGQPQCQPDRARGHQERQRLRAGRLHRYPERRQLRRREADRVAHRGPRQERGLRLGLRPPARPGFPDTSARSRRCSCAWTPG